MQIHILFSQNCNQSCDYCFAKILLNSTNMSYKNFIELLEFLANNNESVLHLIGGEPTLHPRFNKFIRHALENYPNITQVNIITNGLFKMSCFDNIELNKCKLSFNITDRIDNQSLIRNILFVKLRKSKYDFCLTLNKDTFDIMSYVYFTKKYKPQRLLLNLALPQIDHKNNYVVNISDHYKKKIVFLTKKILELRVLVEQDCFTPLCLFNENKELLYGLTKIAKCSHSFFISTNLQMYVCPFMNIPLGKITRATRMEELDCIQKNIADKTNHLLDNNCIKCVYKIRKNCIPCAAYNMDNLKNVSKNCII